MDKRQRRFVILLLIVLSIIVIVVPIVVQKTYVKHGRETLVVPDPEYRVREFPGFLSPEECDSIISTAKEHGLVESLVYSSENDVSDGTRSSEQTWLRDHDSDVIKTLSKRIADIVSIPVENQEALQVVRYGEGGKFEPHYDACVDDENGKSTDCKRMNGESGPRVWTFLIYLNDVPEGGETAFPHLGLAVKPERGKAVLFQNVSLDSHTIILEAQHGGNPVGAGEKWIANKWIRPNPYHD